MPLRAIKPQHETQIRILDAAEELFMQHGFEGASMRMLTARAEVNLAAINYHFGSKDALIEAVFRRRLDPMNEARIAELERLETEAQGRPLAAERIIRAFIGPSLALIGDARCGGRNFIRLLGRTYTDPSKGIRHLIGGLYAPAMACFKAAFEKSLPQMPSDELVWRMHFMFGTLAYTLGAAVLFVIANLCPIVGLEASGNRTSTTLIGTVRTLHETDMTSVAALVFVTTILMPMLDIGAMLYMLLPLKFGWVPRGLPATFRLIQTVRPWGMVEVFMLGTLVSLAKLSHLAHVVPGIGLWSFGALMFLVAAAAATFDPRELWARADAAARQRPGFEAGTAAREATT